MSKVLIISRTRMNNSRHCVGGLEKDTNRSPRLLTKDKQNQNSDCPYKIGQIWDFDFKKKDDIKLPHTEDVLLLKEKFIQTVFQNS